jgi:hypothetical protein
MPMIQTRMKKVKRMVALVGGTILPHLMTLTAWERLQNPHDEEWVGAQTSPKNNDLLGREKLVSLESRCTALFYTFII